MFTTGSDVAVTTADVAPLIRMGLPMPIRRGRVLGSTEMPVDVFDLSQLSDHDREALEFYVIAPVNPDGSDLDNPAAADAAFVVGFHREQDANLITSTPDGVRLAITTAVKEVSRSEFVASVEARNESEFEIACSELDADLANLAASQDDDDEFFGRASD